MKSKDKTIIQRVSVLLIFSIIGGLSLVSNSNSQEPRKIVYFGDENCHLCHEKLEIVNTFLEDYPDVELELNMMNLMNPDNLDLLQQELEKYGIETVQVPIAILIHGDNYEVLYYEDITIENLELWYSGGITGSEAKVLNLSVSFITGIIIGASPCVLLILGVFGSSLSLNQSEKKYNSIMTGFISGLLVTYIIVSLVFLFAINSIGAINYFKYIFASILLIIGLWQIIDYKNENSTIFGTPQKIKNILREKFSQNSFQAAFSIGLIFAFVKIPCFGGTYLTILFNAREEPQLWLYILLYLLGMIIPIIITFIILKKGLKQEKIDSFRLKYRSHLRILSGLFIITITLNLLLEQYGFSLLYLIVALLGEILFTGYSIQLKKKKEKYGE